MVDVFKDVHYMHEYYKIEVPKKPTPLPKDIMHFRLKFLHEELNEFTHALLNNDFPEQVDALIDLMVVAAGTLDMMGIRGELHWNEVHKCNMSKEVVKSASESKRGSAIDLKKPEGWLPPNHEMLLEIQGWEK